uniref:Uncharacterized protein n=1 Tax=Anopheles atroparvus TaxID=41427 RepID=A0A182ISL9_ANOAO
MSTSASTSFHTIINCLKFYYAGFLYFLNIFIYWTPYIFHHNFSVNLVSDNINNIKFHCNYAFYNSNCYTYEANHYIYFYFFNFNFYTYACKRNNHSIFNCLINTFCI